jgi:hypothetical protein
LLRDVNQQTLLHCARPEEGQERHQQQKREQIQSCYRRLE